MIERLPGRNASFLARSSSRHGSIMCAEHTIIEYSINLLGLGSIRRAAIIHNYVITICGDIQETVQWASHDSTMLIRMSLNINTTTYCQKLGADSMNRCCHC